MFLQVGLFNPSPLFGGRAVAEMVQVVTVSAEESEIAAEASKAREVPPSHYSNWVLDRLPAEALVDLDLECFFSHQLRLDYHSARKYQFQVYIVVPRSRSF